MANITIYLSGAVEQKVRKAAKASKQPLSRWISEQLMRSVESGWPREVLDAAGSMPDFPDLEILRRGYGEESAREKLD